MPGHWLCGSLSPRRHPKNISRMLEVAASPQAGIPLLSEIVGLHQSHEITLVTARGKSREKSHC